MVSRNKIWVAKTLQQYQNDKFYYCALSIIKYSAIKTVNSHKNNSQKSVAVVNLVIDNQINLLLSGCAPGTYDFRLLNSTGLLLQKGKLVHDGTGYNTINISIGLSKGLYLLQLGNGVDFVEKSLVIL